jgi:hypothetical protein
MVITVAMGKGRNRGDKGKKWAVDTAEIKKKKVDTRLSSRKGISLGPPQSDRSEYKWGIMIGN